MKTNKFFLKQIVAVFASFLSLIFVTDTVSAASGACSGHGGVSCASGADFDGSVICMDGWTGSSVSYSSMVMCAGYGSGSSYTATTCPSHSTYNYLSDSCKCNVGYIVGKDFLGKTACVDADSLCRDDLGLMSNYNSLTNACECDSGYVLHNGTCTYAQTVCSLKYGTHSSYQSYSNSCVCDTGYIFGSNEQCVKKENKIYALLIESSSNMSEVILMSSEDYGYYAVNYGLGCYSSTIEKYIGSFVTINTGNDKYIDAWDKLELPSDNQSCNITGVETVDAGYTYVKKPSVIAPLICSSEQVLVNGTCLTKDAACTVDFGANSKWNGNYSDSGNLMCSCKAGYEWTSDGRQCVLSTVAINPTAPVADPLINLITPDPKLVSKLKGYILLQTQSHGEAWYVHPISGKRYYMQNGAVAYQMMRSFGLGVAETDYTKIINGDSVLKNKLKGKIILRAQAHGEAYYIHPKSLELYYLKDGEEAYRIMRLYSLGITDSDINKLQLDVIPQK